MTMRTIKRLTRVAAPALLTVAALGVGAPAAEAAQPAHGRAWEMVSDPRASSSAAPASAYGIVPTGDRIAYMRLGPGPGSPVGSTLTVNLATRGGGGWTDTPLGYPYVGGEINDLIPRVLAATPDLSTMIWVTVRPLLPGAPGNGAVSGLYRAAVGGSPTLLSAGGGFGDRVAALSDDGERVVFQTTAMLVGEDSVRSSYEGTQVYGRDDDGVRLLGVDETGIPPAPCGSASVTALAAPSPASSDGRRVFFTAPGCTDYPEALARVFLSEDGESTEISASRCTRPDCGPPAAVGFAGATPDGALAYLVTTAQLTDDDVDDSSDLYRYDTAADSLTRVTAGPVPADAIATRVHPSDDGERVYFLARGQLVAGKGASGSPNAYVLDGGGLRYVATLAEDDRWPTAQFEDQRFPEVQLTPGDGRRLLLVTEAALRAEDTDSALDVYLYDAATGAAPQLVSKPAHGGGAEQPVRMRSGALHTDLPRFASTAPRMLSADGRRVAFMTDESLLPQDGDDTSDVYEWVDGELGLVSAGGGAHDVVLLGISPDGSSVFVTTPERLVSADDDAGDYDLYVARIGGGFPEPPPARVECEDGCPPAPPGRLTRRDPPTLGSGLDGGRAGLRLRQPTARERARMVARGQLALKVRVPVAGRVTALARARVGRRTRVVGRARAGAAKAGTVTLRVTLSGAARRRLQAGRDLTVRVLLRHSRLDGAVARARLVLRGIS